MLSLYGTKTLFERSIMGGILLLERHHKECDCSYCQEERVKNRKIRWVLNPYFRSRNAWSRISYRHKDNSFTYLRTTRPELNYFLGYRYTSWGTGFRISILPAPICRPNSGSALITYAKPSCYKTKIKGVESLFWKSMIRFIDVGDGGVSVDSRQ
jgi:hypothetical protein